MKVPHIFVCCVCIVLACTGLLAACSTPTPPTFVRQTTQCRATLAPDGQEDWVGRQIIDYCLPDDLDALVLWVGCSTVQAATWQGEAMAVAQEGVYATLSWPQTMPRGTVGQLCVDFRLPMAAIVHDYLPLVCAYGEEGFDCPQAVDFAPYAHPDAARCTLLWHLPAAMSGCHTGQCVALAYDGTGPVLTYTLAAGPHSLVLGSGYVVQQHSPNGAQLVTYERTAGQLRRAEDMVQNGVDLWGETAVTVVYATASRYTQGLVLTDDNKYRLCLALATQWLLPHTAGLQDWVLPSLAYFYRWYYYQYVDPNVAQRLHDEAVEDCRLYSALGEYGGLDARQPLAAYDALSYAAVLGQRGLLMWYALYQLKGERLMTAIKNALQEDPTQEEFWEALARDVGDCRAYCEPWLAGKVPII